MDCNAEHAEPNGNLWRTLKLMALYAQDLPHLMARTTNYTSPDVQNELLSLMANSVLREIVREINSAAYFTIMIDETTDTSNREQAVICIR